MSSGCIFNIQKFSIHDGPGIRTTVFLKGCPLSCWWCHNPESQSSRPQLVFYEARCIGCRQCLAVCEAASKPEQCKDCGRCAEVCYAGAREMAGRTVSVDEVMAEVEKDMVFYEQSGGGVTFSGGEPLMQPGFLSELLVRCHAKGIHTAVDTCGYCSSKELQEISKNTDLFLYDLKLIDDEKHKKYTGVSNKSILENIGLLDGFGKQLAVRIPVIPGINDDAQDIEAFCEVIKKLKNVVKVHILPYHSIASEKYRRLKQEYGLKSVAEPSDEHMQHLVSLFSSYGVNVKIGG